MKKHLIYLGYTGNAHRIALFDENNILALRVTVKDVPVLTDDLEFLNCSVCGGGKVYPNLKGESVSSNYSSKCCQMHGERSLRRRYAPYDKTLFIQMHAMHIWDGRWNDYNCYLIGRVCVPKNEKRYETISSVLCMTAYGDLFFASYSDMAILSGRGVYLIQAGTTDLYYPNSYHKSKSCKDTLPSLGIPKKDLDKAIWFLRPVTEDLYAKCTAVWRLTNGPRSTMLDFRCYKEARVFGLASIGESGTLIYPESTEVVWLSMLYACSSLKAVYLPESVDRIYDYGLSSRNVKRMKFYSNSPKVKEFCDKYKATYIPCSSSEKFLAKFYEADTKYVDVAGASVISSLAGVDSGHSGESHTVWSAVLFSCQDRGVATDTLQEKYPVVATCNYEVPTNDIVQEAKEGLVKVHDELTEERVRLLAAAFTQFYPLSTKELELDDGDEKYVMYKLGTRYNLYVGVNFFNANALYGRIPVEKIPDSLLGNLALLEDVVKGRIIHRFECSNMIHDVMRSIEAACVINRIPCGVLRYADKLPVIENREGARYDDTENEVAREIFSTMLLFDYETKVAKSHIVGIDMHTGEITTIDVTRLNDLNSRKYRFYGDRKTSLSFSSVSKLLEVKQYTDARAKLLFAKDCVYNKNRVER